MPAGPEVRLELTAQDFAFDKGNLTVPPGARVTLVFTNKDVFPHNFALYTNQTYATPVFKGEIITGPRTITYQFTAPEQQGAYYFRCDVHAIAMTGSFVVVGRF